MTSPLCLESLNDHALLSQFGNLVRQDHEGKANLIRHIDAIDRRKLWAKLGHSSLFGFLVVRYHMSESTAAKRIGAARTARRFPILFTMIAHGEIHLSGIHRLAAHLTPENHASVLAEAKHKTIRQIEKLVARLAPQPDVPSTLRALPSRNTTSAAPPPATQTSPPQPPLANAVTTTTASPAVAPQATALPSQRSPDPVPLSPARYKLQVTLGEEEHSKLEQLQDLLAHQIPNSDPALIVERALDALLTEVLKRKTAATEKPRAPKAATPKVSGRSVRSGPAAVRRQVWKRDSGRCTFVGADGHQCNETRRLEFAHLEPWANGGETTVDNLALRCQAHNAWEADRDYGTGFMARKRGRAVSTSPAEQAPLKLREPRAPYATRSVSRRPRPASADAHLPSGLHWDRCFSDTGIAR